MSAQAAEPCSALDPGMAFWPETLLGEAESYDTVTLAAADASHARPEAPLADELRGTLGTGTDTLADGGGNQCEPLHRDVWLDIETPSEGLLRPSEALRGLVRAAAAHIH